MLTLTRTQFDTACKAYIDAHPNDHVSVVNRFPSGWVWREHSYIAGLGYLERTVCLPQSRRSAQYVELEDPDENTAPMAEQDDTVCESSSEVLTCTQYVVHSTAFQVPAFYFTLHDSSGCPLSLERIMTASLFRPQALPPSQGGTFALSVPDSTFSLLSQGDHPTLGTPCWYFHPCHTSEVVGEIMAEVDAGERNAVRWLEVWFMVMSNMVDLFAGDGI